MPGTIAGHLDQRVGDFVRRAAGRGGGGAGGDGRRRAASCSIELAKGNGTINDPTIRQDLMRLHTLDEIARIDEPAARRRAQGRPARTSPAWATSPSCR